MRRADKKSKINVSEKSELSDLSESFSGITDKNSIYGSSGGYRFLKTFQIATVIYDGTLSFCNRFVNPQSRTHDQMVQAARSGRQNIAEGSCAAATSIESEAFLTNVGKGSLEELQLDYEDYLRHNRFTQWPKDSKEAMKVRELSEHSDPDPIKHYKVYEKFIEDKNSCVAANTILCLIHQADFLLEKQLDSIERKFIEQGGLRERMYRIRNANKEQNRQKTEQKCPKCGSGLILRVAKQGVNAGSNFWGCSKFPNCRGILPFEG